MRGHETKDNLWIAAGDGQLDRVKELIEGGANVNSHDEFGYTALHAAVSYNQKEILEYLLEKGGNVNIEDFDKDTPLYVAETVEMARLLVDKGADPKHKNEEGVSPALNAHQEGWQQVATMLAEITKEELPTVDDHIEQALENATVTPAPSANPFAVAGAEGANDNSDGEEDDNGAMEHYIEDMVRRIQEQGGVQNEEELREAVTKMVLEQLQNSMK
ncbi:ankyrin repeat-containing domain protein [Zychaea mexicana]|uniref:ankyrin repeat-containing domain protein n=1 Tax=Zychaea mexicana TaxID=64656 RepID=UPI0022FDCE24|nr:ankyrin repeat-containing domain protein [Zychaea mexicana]KAI9491846.1 ankyrin repeat-containing domain protein [Zychaea mexicana]